MSDFPFDPVYPFNVKTKTNKNAVNKKIDASKF